MTLTLATILPTIGLVCAAAAGGILIGLAAPPARRRHRR